MFMQQSTGTASELHLFLCADRIEAAFGFASAAINTIPGYFIVILPSGVDDRFGRADALACAAKLALIRVDFMHFFLQGTTTVVLVLSPKNFHHRPAMSTKMLK